MCIQLCMIIIFHIGYQFGENIGNQNMHNRLSIIVVFILLPPSYESCQKFSLSKSQKYSQNFIIELKKKRLSFQILE